MGARAPEGLAPVNGSDRSTSVRSPRSHTRQASRPAPRASGYQPGAGESALSVAVSTAADTVATGRSADWRMQVEAPDWSLRTPGDLRSATSIRGGVATLLGGLAVLLAVLLLTVAPSAPAPATTGTPPAAEQTVVDLDVVRMVALAVIALVAMLAAVALLSPRRDPVRLTVAAGAAARVAEPSPSPSASAAAPATSAAAPAGSSANGTTGATSTTTKGTTLLEAEPVVVQGVATAVLVAAGVLGINTIGPVEGESLVNVAVPLVPLLGALFARSRVTPVPPTKS